MTDTYLRASAGTMVIAMSLILAVGLALISMGCYIKALNVRIDRLESKVNGYESRMNQVEEVFEQASEIKAYILKNAKCTPRQASEIAYQIMFVAKMEGLDPKLLAGMAKQESDFTPGAVGKLNERGLVQVRPTTFSEWHAGDLADWRATLEAGARYLSYCMRRFRDQRLAVAAYNAGPNRPTARILELSSRYAGRIMANRRAIGGAN
ncbi:MAG: transglycosylase SLT domain-containing protein [Bacteroidota bacterium]